MDDVDRTVVGLDLFTGLASVTGVLLVGGFGIATHRWWVGVFAAICAGALLAAADRTPAGPYVFRAGGGLGVAGVL